MFKSLSPEKKFQLFLSALALAGLFFILLTTAKYGAGVSSDAGRNLSTADNLLKGKGFVDMTGGSFLLWPPLYPLAMAGLSFITRWSVFQSGWYLNVLLYAVNIWLSGWLLFLTFKDKKFYAVIGTLIILLSRSILRIYANIASEPLFITFMLIFFLSAAQYLQTKSQRALWIMFVMAGLATFQRYLGIILFGVGGLVVLSKENWRGILQATPAIIVSVLPIGAWALFHNYPVSGTFFGPRDLGAMFPLENISLSLTKILWWFIPRLSLTEPLILRPWTILIPLILILVIFNRKNNWLNWLKSLANIYIWPGLIFAIVYFLTLAFTVVTADHLDLTSDRYYIIILPIVLTFLFVTFDKLILDHINSNNRVAQYVMIGIVGLWFIYPLYSMQEYLRTALVKGESSNYNIANSADFHERGVTIAAQKILAKDPSALVYSNYLNIVWFLFQHPVSEIPFIDQSQSRDQQIAGIKQYYPDWPPQSGYIVWYTPNEYHHIAAPDELTGIADLKLLYSDKSGQVYYVTPKKP
jgi:hypothetical protein